MVEWQGLDQAAIIGFAFAFFVASIISIVFSFRDDLKFVPEASRFEAVNSDRDDEERDRGMSTEEEEGLLGEGGSDDSDWEGIENTELHEDFRSAVSFVADAAGSGSADRISPKKQLQLYGLYKISIEGPCTAPQPPSLKKTTRAKWNAWQKLGAMPPEEAMERYIMIVNELYPSWSNGSEVKKNKEDALTSNSGAKGPMGPNFSSYAIKKDSGNELQQRRTLNLGSRSWTSQPR